MDINPNLHQDEENTFVERFGDRPGEAALWLRLDSLIRSLDKHHESIEALHSQLSSEIRLMNESGLLDEDSLERRQAYIDAVDVIDKWLKAING